MQTRKKVVFLSSAHQVLDDRIFYHMADTLKEEMEVAVVTTTSEMDQVIEGVKVFSTQSFNRSKRSKIRFFVDYLWKFKPDIIICSEPLPVYSAWKYKKKANKN